MSDVISAEEAQKLLDELLAGGAFPYRDDIAVAYRTVIALHAQLAEAKAAQALVVEYFAAIERLAVSASIASCTCNTKTPNISFHAANCRYVTLQYIIAQCEDFRALADPSGVEALAALRAEIARKDQAIEAWREDLTNMHNDNRDLRARLAAAEAQVGALLGLLRLSRGALYGTERNMHGADVFRAGGEYYELGWLRDEIATALASEHGGAALPAPPEGAQGEGV